MRTAKELVLCALLGAILHAAKFAMSFLPNIEPVTLLLAVYVLTVGAKRTLWATAVFVGLEGLLYGFGLWFWCYCYVWPLWVLTVWLLRRNTARVLWAVAAGAYGMSFGALMALPYLAIGGPAMLASVWISGIPWDVAHCAGNFVLALALLPGLCKAFGEISRRAAL